MTTPLSEPPITLASDRPWARVHFDQFLAKHPNTKYIRFYWIDYTASLRGRVFPVRTVLDILTKNSEKENNVFPMGDSLRLISSAFGLIQTDMWTSGHGFKPVGEGCLVPYFDTIHSCSPWAENQASVLCSLYDLEDQGQKNTIIGPNPHDPLDCLLRAERTAEDLGLGVKAGFECEFVLFEQASGTPVNSAFSYSVMRAISKDVMHVLDQVYDSLMEKAEIPVLYFHKESAPGQYEIALGVYSSLHRLVAALIHARETVHSVANQNGFRASFAPKPFAMAAGNGSHLHLSVSPNVPEDQKRQIENSFLSGLLNHLPAACAFTLPSPSSYERVSPAFSGWSGSGGGFVSWGPHNREAAVRQIHDGHWEIKVVDALANPCLAVAALVASGIQGVKKQYKLEMGPCLVDPAHLNPEQRKELGMNKIFPATVEQAWEEATKDQDLIEAMDASKLVGPYLAVRQTEAKSNWEGKGEEERREWILERY